MGEQSIEPIELYSLVKLDPSFVLGALVMFFVSDIRIVTVEVANVDVKTRMVTDDRVPIGGFDTRLDAVEAASNRYNPDSVSLNREHVGGILNCANRYFYTHGVGAIGHAPVRFSIAFPKRCKLDSLWHTHGGRFLDREYFSPSDTRSADKTGIPIFMTNHTGKLYVYHPGGRKMSRMGSQPFPRAAALGEVVMRGSGSRIRIATP